MNDEMMNRINELSVSEKILLAEAIWDSIARENDSFDLTVNQKKTLDKRSLDFSEDIKTGRPWEEIKGEFLGKK